MGWHVAFMLLPHALVVQNVAGPGVLHELKHSTMTKHTYSLSLTLSLSFSHSVSLTLFLEFLSLVWLTGVHAFPQYQVLPHSKRTQRQGQGSEIHRLSASLPSHAPGPTRTPRFMALQQLPEIRVEASSSFSAEAIRT